MTLYHILLMVDGVRYVIIQNFLTEREFQANINGTLSYPKSLIITF